MLIIGAGFMGRHVHEGLGGVLSSRRIRCLQDAEDEILRHRPRTLINCAGYTGERSVDDCERNPDKALRENAYLPLLLAEACLHRSVRFVHVSTGCIFHYAHGRSRPITEERQPDFLELVYSRTKIYADAALMALSPRQPLLIVRPRVPLDCRPHPRNILTKLLRFKRVIDVPNSVTYLPDFIRALKHLLHHDACGIYNVVNRGVLRYPELLEAYRRYAPCHRYEVIPFASLGVARTNLVLSTRKLERSGFTPRDIHEVLDECARAYSAAVH